MKILLVFLFVYFIRISDGESVTLSAGNIISQPKRGVDNLGNQDRVYKEQDSNDTTTELSASTNTSQPKRGVDNLGNQDRINKEQDSDDTTPGVPTNINPSNPKTVNPQVGDKGTWKNTSVNKHGNVENRGVKEDKQWKRKGGNQWWNKRKKAKNEIHDVNLRSKSTVVTNAPKLLSTAENIGNQDPVPKEQDSDDTKPGTSGTSTVLENKQKKSNGVSNNDKGVKKKQQGNSGANGAEHKDYVYEEKKDNVDNSKVENVPNTGDAKEKDQGKEGRKMKSNTRTNKENKIPSVIEDGSKVSQAGDESNMDDRPQSKDTISTEQIYRQRLQKQVIPKKSSKGSGHFVIVIFVGLFLSIVCYVIFQKRNKILGYIIEGKKSTRSSRTPGANDSKVPYTPLMSEDKESGRDDLKYVF